MAKIKQEMIYGIRAVIEAINKEEEVDKVLIRTGLGGELFKELFRLVRDKDIAFQYVPDEKLKALDTRNNQGVIAFISPVEYQDLTEVVDLKLAEGKKPVILFLDGVTDVRNFGAIARSAECAGVDAIVIPHKFSAKICPDAIKTSAGALYNIPVCKVVNMRKEVKTLKFKGFTVFAATEKAEQKYTDADFTEPTVIIMGSEDKGIKEDLLEQANNHVKIPILGEIESLNVAVAASLMVYEIVRQRAL
ncbi:MAG: 23S rRNA (guanosine(2251)-2'-O)-methyltransferase RlmB [Marinifilaceae bacterium]